MKPAFTTGRRGNINHHLHNVNGTWAVHYTVQDPPRQLNIYLAGKQFRRINKKVTSKRITRSLGTKCEITARRMRDQIFSQI